MTGPPTSRSGRRWWLELLAVVVAGLAVRLVYVLVILRHTQPGYDAIWYTLQGGNLRAGNGFSDPRSVFDAQPFPTAGFPPAYPAFQAAWQWLAGGGPTSVRLAGLLPGAATIALSGMLGRRVLGPRWGLVVAAVVALDPALVAVDGATMSENLTVAFVLAAVATTLALVDGTETRRGDLAVAVGLGAVCGAAILSRQDLMLLVPLLGLAVVLAGPGERWRRVVVAVVVLVVAGGVVAPWSWRNHQRVGTWSVSLGSPNSALAGANCDRTYAGPDLGSWSFDCVSAARATAATQSEVDVAAAYRRVAVGHVRLHLPRVPAVVAARQARAWSWWDPRDLARRDAEESRRYGWQVVTEPISAVLTVLGFVGLVVLVRRRRVLLVLLAPLAVVAASVTLSYGNPRFAVIAQPILVIGAVALAARCFSSRGRTPDLSSAS